MQLCEAHAACAGADIESLREVTVGIYVHSYSNSSSNKSIAKSERVQEKFVLLLGYIALTAQIT